MSKLLEGLNKAQKDAVISYEHPSLIIAGAGSGKTRVLTARIGYMLENGVDPRSIIALTFTNKAASQMKERLFEMVDRSKAYAISMGTFHSIFGRIISENAELLGYTSSFTTYTSSESKSLIKTITKELQLDEDRYKPGVVASRISFAKNSLVTPGAYSSNETFLMEDRTMQIPQFAKIYATYCARCKAANALDFDDYLLQTNFLFRDHPEVLARYQERFQYILVDEYQDTNYAQYIIIRRLAQKHSRVCVVGDDAQSIYSFRGAKIENIINFKSHFPTAKTFKLEQNYRSTQTIVDAANSVITHNSNRLDKKCFSAGDVGEKITIIRSYTDRDEAYSLAESISRRVKESGAKWSEFAILYRNNSQAQSIEQALRQRSIPYQIHKGNSFFEQKEVKDILAYIRLIVNPKDDDAFKRIVNYPTRGIGNTTIDRLESLAREQDCSMWYAAQRLIASEHTDARMRSTANKIREFMTIIGELSAEREKQSLYSFGHTVAMRSGILPLFKATNSAENTTAVDNIEELLNTMQLFDDQFVQDIANGERGEDEVPSAEEWLQGVMLLTDQDKGGAEGAEGDEEQNNKVTLMTVHTSKGLEYEYIYIAGVEQNLFPSQRAMESGEIEEERRLFYVALTRAKIAAAVSFCDMRYKWGTMTPSRASLFINEIDKKFVEMEDGSSIEGALRPRASAQQDAPERFERKFERPFINRERELRAPQYNERESNETRERIEAQRQQKIAIEQRIKGMKSLGLRRNEERAEDSNEPIKMPWDESSTDNQTNNQTGTQYKVDERIVHEKFGAGRISAVAMVGENEIITVEFEVHGVKKIVANKAPIKRV